MKRLALFLCLLALLFSACTAKGDALSMPEAEARIEKSLSHAVRADDDFVVGSVGTPEYLSDSAVYLLEDGEIGLFTVSDPSHVKEMEERIRTYLATEKGSVEQLAELYPAEELSRRLDRFAHAKIGHQGNLVYYFLADDSEALARLLE